MNTTPTSPRRELDTFESALLQELRSEVTRSASASPRPARGRRRLALGAAAAAVTGVVAVALGAGPGSTPAYAVTEDSSGDVVVTVHELQDASGLEDALRAHGIDADVTFDDRQPEPGRVQFPLPEGGIDAPSDDGGPARLGLGGCGVEDTPAAKLEHPGSDWVLTVPAGSPLMTRPVQIAADGSGDLSVIYIINGSLCAVLSMH